MPMFANRYYDVRPCWPTWTWSAFGRDLVTLIGRGEVATVIAAEAAARSRILQDRAGNQDGLGRRCLAALQSTGAIGPYRRIEGVDANLGKLSNGEI